jgi:hypothetical protein
MGGTKSEMFVSEAFKAGGCYHEDSSFTKTPAHNNLTTTSADNNKLIPDQTSLSGCPVSN